MSNEDKKAAWDSWEYELPKTNEKHDCKEYKLLHDEKFHRELTQEIRQNAFARLAKECKDSKAAVVLQGGTSEDFNLYDTDVDKCPFRQEHFFQYLFQINHPDCYGVLDLERKESLLFIPYLEDAAERWEGDRRPLSHYVERYGVDHAYYTSQLDEQLQARGIKHLYLLYGQNNDSDCFTTTTANFKGIEKYTTDKHVVHHVLTELRSIKTDREITLMRLGNLVTSQAHVYVMRHASSCITELQLEALFQAWTRFYGGSRHMAYTCICGTGPHGAILHYGHAGRPNDRLLQDGDRVVLDMGAEYYGYATDVTRSYPVNGKFSDDQRAIHTAVYEAQQAVMKALKPGVRYTEMHKLAERVILTHLLKIGILHKGTVEEMEAAFMGSVFMPHGLGHMLGMDTHDVGGYHGGIERAKEPGVCYLRLARALQKGMVLTVEPGIYFNEPTLNKALKNPAQAKFINEDVLKRFRGTGGVRLEDDVLITADGCENLTVLPTSVEEIERVFALAKRRV